MTEITISVTSREANALKAFVSANSIDLNTYIWEAVSERLNKDRYGDMNEMVKKTKNKKEKPPKKAKDDAKLDVKDTPTQKNDETVQNTDAKASTPTETDATEEKETKTKRRVLKVKR